MPSPPTERSETGERRPLEHRLVAFAALSVLALLAALILAAILAAVAAWSSAAAAPAPSPPAEPRALLIGVGDYPGLPERLRLTASAADARLMRTALVQAGFPERGVTLMDEREGVRPTRAAVLQALRLLAVQARPGQPILIYLSGHGAQAPARHPEREPDGLEELYLMADAAGWDGGTRSVPGSIADFELEALIDDLRAKGADVWFVADACHGAGLTRGAAGEGRAKTVSAADLRIPLPAVLRGAGPDRLPLRPAPARGAFAAFYAAAPGELAVERLLPPGSSAAAPRSVFTYALAAAIADGRTRTLRDLAQAAAARTAGLGGGAAPVFEGALDLAPPLAGQARRYPVQRTSAGWRVAAGSLDGFAAGEDVALVQAGQSAGRTRVLRAGAAEAWLEPAPDLKAGELLAEPSGAQDRGRRIADLAARTEGQGPAAALRLELRRLRAGCGPNPPARLGFPPAATPLDPAAAPELRHCDVIYLRIENAGARAVDVSPLYLDADGRVQALSLSPTDDVRLSPGETRFAAVRILTHDASGRPLPHGREHLILLAAEAANTPRTDLRTLADPTLRGGPPADLGSRTITLDVSGD